MAKLTYQEIEFRLLLLQISALLCDMTCHCQNQTNIICLNENKLNSVIHNEEKFDFSNFCIDAIILKLTMLKNSQIQTILSANLSKVIFAEISNSENFIMSEDVFLNLRNLQEKRWLCNHLKGYWANFYFFHDNDLQVNASRLKRPPPTADRVNFLIYDWLTKSYMSLCCFIIMDCNPQ